MGKILDIYLTFHFDSPSGVNLEQLEVKSVTADDVMAVCQGCQILHPNWVRLAPNETNL